MVDDLGAYLVAIGVYTDPEEVENFDYDTGVEELEGVVTVHGPNGIPDAAELMSLQAVLQNPGIETKDSGVSHMALWKIYLTNLAQAQFDLSAQSPAVQRAVAAYMTLGSFGHVGQVLEDVQTHFGVTLDRFLYPNAGDRWFAADKDMDRDGVTNKQEWDYAVAQTAEAKSGSLGAAAAAYAAAAPTHGEGEGPADLPDTGSPGDFDTSCAATAKLKVLPTGNSPYSDVTVRARIMTPDGGANVLVLEGQEAIFPVGVEVKVEASDSGWFRNWSAPDSLLHGSDSATDSFILTGDTDVTGSLKGIEGFNYPESASKRVSVRVAGGDEPLELFRSGSYVSNRYIAVREGTLLRAEGLARFFPTTPLVPATRLKVNVDYRNVDTDHWGSVAMINPAEVELITPQAGIPPQYGLGTFSATVSNGRASVSMAAPRHMNPFVGRVGYPIPGGPGTTWTRATGATFDVDTSCYIYDTDIPSATHLNPNPTATATVNAKSVLTLGEAECDCDMEHHGSASLENAKRYYLGPTPARTNAELVGVSARANPGHVVKGLKIEGGGQVWRWVGEDYVEDFVTLDDMFPAEADDDGFYVGDDLYVEMNTDATVTPVVELDRPYVVVLGGENFEPGDGAGVWNWAADIPQDKFIVDMFDEEGVNNNGSGIVYDTIEERYLEGEFRRLIIVGYSHGGGSLTNLCERLAENYSHDFPGMRVIMTGYWDAIEHDWELDHGCEQDLPPLSEHHINLFQTLGGNFPVFVNGCAVAGSALNLDINTLECAEGNRHTHFDDCEVVWNITTEHMLFVSYCVPAALGDPCASEATCIVEE